MATGLDVDEEVDGLPDGKPIWISGAYTSAADPSPAWHSFGPLIAASQSVRLSAEVRNGQLTDVRFDSTEGAAIAGACCRIRIRIRIVIHWTGGGNSGGTQAPSPQQSAVYIETDPSPPIPDVWCMSPQRMRNSEAFPVVVRFERTFWSEGPSGCYPTHQTDQRDMALAAANSTGSALFIGCSTYSNPAYVCVEQQRWRIVSVRRAQ